MNASLFHPIAEPGRELCFALDGVPLRGWAGDTVIAAVLRSRTHLGRSEFDGTARAGFCLMGSCQDCTLWDGTGRRFRACMEDLRDGMDLHTSSPLGRIA